MYPPGMQTQPGFDPMMQQHMGQPPMYPPGMQPQPGYNPAMQPNMQPGMYPPGTEPIMMPQEPPVEVELDVEE